MLGKSPASRLITFVLCPLLFPASLHASTLFKPAKSYPSGGTGASSVAVADVNKDGKLDLVVSNGFACDTCTNGSISVLLGNGDGTFQPAVSYNSGGWQANQIAVADLNGDEKLDVLVANSCATEMDCNNAPTGSVAVLLGNGDGTFRAAKIFHTGGQVSRYLALGDFNRDGKLDVAVAGGGGRKVAILLGTGRGTFQAPRTIDLPGDQIGIAAGDINGDKKLDLVVGLLDSFGQGGTSIALLGNGDGTFASQPVLSPSGSYPALADLDGDGKLDLVVTTACGPKCSQGGVGVLLGNGDGSFQPMQIYGSGSTDADFISVGDLNRDGTMDVVVSDYGSSSTDKVGVLLGAGGGILSPVKTSNPGIGGAFAMAIADVNGDGKPDLISVLYLFNGTTDGAVSVLLNNTFWTTTTTLTSSPNPSVQGQTVTLRASVTTQGSIAPTGRVLFKNGTSLFGNAPLIAGVATFNTAKLPAGTLSLTATYIGDVNSARSTSPVVLQVVNPPAQ
jgi:hypothetical protein